MPKPCAILHAFCFWGEPTCVIGTEKACGISQAHWSLWNVLHNNMIIVSKENTFVLSVVFLSFFHHLWGDFAFFFWPNKCQFFYFVFTNCFVFRHGNSIRSVCKLPVELIWSPHHIHLHLNCTLIFLIITCLKYRVITYSTCGILLNIHWMMLWGLVLNLLN